MAKMAINIGAETELHTGLAVEKLAQLAAFQTRDKVEGIAAFLEKRTPEFKGE
jgi:enoyl-CoA hydratase